MLIIDFPSQLEFVMLIFKKRILATLTASCLLTSMAIAQDGTDPSSKAVTTSVPTDGVSDQMRMDQMAMQQMMKSQKMMTKAKEGLMSDDEMATRVAREILLQEMVKDKKYLKMMRDGLSADTDDEPKMKELVEKISAAKAKMLKDKDGMMSLTQELMVRQLAANRIAMMNGGRFGSELLEKVRDEKMKKK